MPFEYSTNLDAIINVLRAHNTTTATPDLSNSLTTRIADDDIQRNDPEIVNVRADRLPAVYVRISNKDEDFEGIGSPGATSARVKKRATVTFDVIALFAKEGGHDSHENALAGIYTMARNIEGVLTHEFSLSNTALWCAPVSTDFYGPFQMAGTWVKTALIKTQAVYLFR